MKWVSSAKMTEKRPVQDDCGVASAEMDSVARFNSHEREMNLCHCSLGLSPLALRFLASDELS